MRLIEVSDPSDPRLDDFRQLIDADVRVDRRGVVIAEGVNVVERLAGSPYRIRAVAAVASKAAEIAHVLETVDVDVLVLDKWTLSDVVGFRVTRGILASADRPPPPTLAGLLASARRVAVLERLNDFENLGALFRNAAAFGVDAVLLDPQTADPLYRRSVRVSMGYVLRVPFATLPGPWPDSLGLLSDFTKLGMTPRESATDLRRLPPMPRWAVILGAEGPGLSDAVLGRCDELVRIPMAPGVDSLNVATAAAVAFSHLA